MPTFSLIWTFFVAPSERKKRMNNPAGLKYLFTMEAIYLRHFFLERRTGWHEHRRTQSTLWISRRKPDVCWHPLKFSHSFTEPEAFHAGTRRENSSFFVVSRSTCLINWKTRDDLLWGKLDGVVSGELSLWWTSNHLWRHWNAPCFRIWDVVDLFSQKMFFSVPEQINRFFSAASFSLYVYCLNNVSLGRWLFIWFVPSFLWKQ